MLGKLWLRHWYILSILIICLIAVVVRFYQLGNVPRGMTWDEAAIAYNGYGIVTVRRDEWLQKLPVSFRSFGDYKAPFAIYTVGIFVTLLGSELWIVRLPFAISGVLGVLGFILLSREIFEHYRPGEKIPNKWLSSERLALASGLLLTLSPWHLHFSRVGFESGLALTWVIWGGLFFYRALGAPSKHFGWWLTASGVAFVGSLYTYHSAKVFVPLLVLCLVLLHYKKLLHKARFLASVAAATLSGFILLPLLYDSFFASGGERFTQASVFGLELSTSQIVAQIATQFFQHFSPWFLVGGATDTLRHGDGTWGVLFLTTFSLGVVGVIAGLLNLYNSRYIRFTSRYFVLTLVWIGAGILPAAVGRDIPHSNRALLALPGFILLAQLGFSWCVAKIQTSQLNKKIVGTHQEKNILVVSFIGILILLHTLFFLAYQKDYYTEFVAASADDFKDGYLEMFEFVKPYEEGHAGYPPISQVIVSSKYGQPYIYALFVKRAHPILYHGGALNRFLFVDEVKPGDIVRENSVIVATGEDDVSAEEADHVIYDAAGKVRFKIYINP